MSVKLISDSACDMTQQEAKAADVTILPLKTMIDGVEYLDGVTITTEEFYGKLETCKELPTTSQAAPSEFVDVLRPIVDAGDEAVIVTLAGKFSGTAQSALVAASEAGGNVFVVDSGSATIGEYIMLQYAIRLRDQGLTGNEIALELERVKSRAERWYILSEISFSTAVQSIEIILPSANFSSTQAVSILNSQESSGSIIENLLINHLYWNIVIMHYGLLADDV